MKRVYIIILVATIASSCGKSIFTELNDCDYNAAIEFSYNEEYSTTDNRLTQVANSLDIYLYDQNGQLVQTQRLDPPASGKPYSYREMLAPGRYSIIALANKSSINDIENSDARQGVTLSLNPDVSQYYNNGDRLYYGYRTFSVGENQMSRVRVDMVHSHLVVRFRIRWKNVSPPMGEYFAVMKHISSEYSLMPQFVYREQFVWEDYDPAKHDNYGTVETQTTHFLPLVYQNRNIVTHKLNLQRNVDGEVKGEFVMYRIKAESIPTLLLHAGRDATGEQLMKEINLQRYLLDRNIDLDHTLRQEYNLDIMIDGDNVLVSSISIADWDEGESL